MNYYGIALGIILRILAPVHIYLQYEADDIHSNNGEMNIYLRV
jgi:hypothetical protein